jgi:hypothetical protein
VSDETRKLLEGHTLAELVRQTRIGHAEAGVPEPA